MRLFRALEGYRASNLSARFQLKARSSFSGSDFKPKNSETLDAEPQSRAQGFGTLRGSRDGFRIVWA